MTSLSRAFGVLALLAIFACGCAAPSKSSDLRLNQIQVIGTHNSYHQRAPESLVRLLKARSPDLAQTLDYSHRPLAEQFDLGIRQIELDCFADPQGGLYAHPRGAKWAVDAGLPPIPNPDPERKLRQPGF